MNKTCRLNQSTEIYLATFYCILDEMICGMTNAPLSDSISHNFIVQMIPHHRAAIEMSENILSYTSDKALRAISSNIITEQTKSIEDMLLVKERCLSPVNTDTELKAYQYEMDAIMKTMFRSMGHACADNQISCDFMWEMIPHHEGAVKMSETTLKYCICPELKPILKAIITSQKKGISEMQALLRRMGCQFLKQL